MQRPRLILTSWRVWLSVSFLSCCLLIVTTTIMPLQPSYAASQSTPARPLLAGLELSPLRARPTLNPGDTSGDKLRISNRTQSAMDVVISVSRFKVTDEDYHYDFSPGEHTDWICLTDSEIHLEPQASKEVAYSLAIPANAPPGGYYFAVLASNESGQSSSAVNEVKQVASLIYLEVSGHITRKATFLGFDLAHLTTKQSSPADNRIVNNGNSHFEAGVSLTVETVGWHHQVSKTQAQGLVLPATVRKIRGQFVFPHWPGLYRVRTTFAPPQGGLQNTSQLVFYGPWWFWTLLVLLFGWLLYVRLHKKRRPII